MKKISVIFFLLCIIAFLIFNKFNLDNINVLYLGDNNIYYDYILNLDKYNIDRYLYDNVLYQDIINDIKDNSFKIIKAKNIYLNQKISNSDVIILSANNFEYNNKCKKIDRVIDDYDRIIENDINELVSIINKISNSKIIVIGNYCNNKKHIQMLNLLNGEYLNYYNIDNLDKIIGEIANN